MGLCQSLSGSISFKAPTLGISYSSLGSPKNANQSQKIKSDFFSSLRVDSQVDDNFLVSISLSLLPLLLFTPVYLNRVDFQ